MAYQFIKLTPNLIVPVTSTIMEMDNKVFVCPPGASDTLTLGPDDGMMLWQVLNSKIKAPENVMTLDVAARWIELQEIAQLGLVPQDHNTYDVNTKVDYEIKQPTRGRPPGSRNRPKIDYAKVEKQLKNTGGLL